MDQLFGCCLKGSLEIRNASSFPFSVEVLSIFFFHVVLHFVLQSWNSEIALVNQSTDIQSVEDFIVCFIGLVYYKFRSASITSNFHLFQVSVGCSYLGNVQVNVKLQSDISNFLQYCPPHTSPPFSQSLYLYFSLSPYILSLFVRVIF